MHPLAALLPSQFRLLVPVLALSFMALEYGLSRLLHHDTHDLTESAASLAVAAGHSLARMAEAGLTALPFALVYQHRLFDFDQTGVMSLLGLFVGTEFLYYWQHRAAHRIRWLWASHAVHHSANRLNFTAAIRLSWTSNITGNFLFFLPLAWIGFHPLAIVGMLGANLLYQFFIHTELAPRLGPLEWVLNTPTHHRVHHASNASCLDRNYGGVLIVFDRMFDTFADIPQGETLRYGLVKGMPSRNPLDIAFGEWIRLFTETRRASGASARLRVLFGPP